MEAPAQPRPEPGFVLVVEDADAHRYLLEQARTRHGFQTLGVATGQAALEALDRAADVVLLDLGLPDLDGHEVAARLRALELPHRPALIAVTARDTAEDRRKASEGGIDFYMVKPVAAATLVGVLGRFAAGRRRPGEAG